ncbi:unnamed protein product [Meganyctiphanes norvegica]|uniref:N-acetyltransferase domain-containing protein n=1 Tax=Meganyctiphanes norvegica TaxID=48144 RepID=A0AAV2SG83_MEGNR
MNTNTSKVLKEASFGELEKLLLKPRFPKYSAIYGLVDMHIRYNIFEGTPTMFFIPTDNNLSSLTVVYPVCERQDKAGPQMITLHWDVDNELDTDIQGYLSSLPDINWDKPVSISGTSTIVLDKIKHILESSELCGEINSMTIVYDGDIYSSEEVPLEIVAPDGYVLGQLKPEHVTYVNKMFGNPLGESDDSIRTQFTKFPGVALYKLSDDGIEDPLPVSWTAVRSNGLIGRTFTLPEYRRSGFATLVIGQLKNKILNAGFIPKLGISRSNSASIKMNEKLGFIKRERAVRAIFSSE